jgi:protein NRD1
VDEFGREIRPSSDDDRSMTPDDLKQRPALSPPPAASVTSAPTVETMSVSSDRESPAAAPSQAAFATRGGPDEPQHHQDASGAGLQSFDYTTFDPTSPASWDTLGKAWAATNGRSPTQEELMMFVMEFTIGMASQAPPSAPPVQQGNPQAGYGWMGEHRGGPPRGRGAFRGRGGRGGFAHSAGGGQKRWDVGDDAYAESTDAIVLGEHTNNQNGFGWTQGSHEQAQASPDGDGDGDGGQMEGGSTAGGRMQKVGDKWMFVRDDGSS